jgi:hypothetical protein
LGRKSGSNCQESTVRIALSRFCQESEGAMKINYQDTVKREREGAMKIIELSTVRNLLSGLHCQDSVRRVRER